MTTAKTIRETDLSGPVTEHLEKLGYTVRAEVNDCDIAALRDDDLIIVELKRGLSVDLLIQATRRQRITDSVYIAIPAPKNFMRRSRWNGIRRLMRMLELGLILVSFHRKTPRVEVVLDPSPYRKQKKNKERRALITEMNNRSGHWNEGGTRGKVVTAYREDALAVACCLAKFGPLSPAQLRELGVGENARAIAYRNVYGWFEHLDRAKYGITPAGTGALDEYADVVREFKESLEGRETPTGKRPRKK
jgi:hypothetical protein